MADKLNIGQRINAVRKTCPYIQKAKAVENYKAVTHDQVTAELRASLIEHGVLVLPRLTHGVTVDTTRRTSKGFLRPGFRSSENTSPSRLNVWSYAYGKEQTSRSAGSNTIPPRLRSRGQSPARSRRRCPGTGSRKGPPPCRRRRSRESKE